MAGIYNDLRITNISPKLNTASIPYVSSGYYLATRYFNPVADDGDAKVIVVHVYSFLYNLNLQIK
jgi:hypothetical protein